jgi:hypothetical protein
MSVGEVGGVLFLFAVAIGALFLLMDWVNSWGGR